MNVRVKSCLNGAKEAEGLAVLIDVFRASNTVIACLAKGADYVHPVETLEEALRIKQDNSEFMLFGERGGLAPDGFDYGNSPVEASRQNLSDKKVVLTTSAGTKGILLSSIAEEVVVGSFANAAAVVEYIQKQEPESVTLVAIGLEGREKAVEDEECARYIKEKLEGGEPDFNSMKEKILEGDGAERLRRLGQEEDLEFCLQLNSYDIVPVYDSERKIIVT